MAAPCIVRVTPEASSARFSSVIIKNVEQLETFAYDWNRLWAADAMAEIFQRFEFARAWWKSFGSGVELRTAVVRRGEGIVGILPLVQRGRKLQFLGAPEFDYNDVICREEHSISVIAAALKTLSEAYSWDEIELGNLPSSSRIMRYWPVVSGLVPFSQLISRGPSCPTILLSRKREETFRTLLGNHHYRRHRNKLQKLGELVFRHIERSDEAMLHMQQLFRQQIRRRALCDNDSRFRDKGFRTMCQSLIQEFGSSKGLRLGVLELDGQPLAYSVGFQVNRKYLFYQQSFDIDAWHLAPGDVLLRSLFEYAQGQDLCEFDFSVGMEAYKSKFANLIRTNSVLHLYRRGPWGWLRRSRESVRSRVVLLASPIKKVRPVAANLVQWIEAMQLLNSRFTRKWRLTPNDFSRPLFVPPELPDSRGSRDSEGQLHVRSARLSDLADLSLDHGQVLTARVLQNLRDRIRAGERVWVAFDCNELVHIATMQEQSGEHGEGCAVDAPDCVIGEIWTSGDYRSPERYQKLLSALFHALRSSGRIVDAERCPAD